MPGRIAIVAAFERELKPLVRGWKRIREGGLSIYESEHAIAVAGGIGSAPAAMAAMVLVAREQPCCLMSIGLAGGLRDDLRVADVMVPNTVVNSVTGKRFTVPGGSGILLSGKIIAGAARKRELRAQFAADILDMEAAGIATVAESCGLPFLAVKAISDEAQFDLPPMMEFVDSEGKFHTGRFALRVIARPSWWKGVFELARNGRKASLILAKQVEHQIQQFRMSPAGEGVIQPH